MGRPKKRCFSKFMKRNSVGTMENLRLSKSLKEAQEQLDPDTVKTMKKYLDELTTSGSSSLDNSMMKKFKQICRKSDDFVELAFLLIMQQLQKKHSEIRLSAFQVANELFNRSHAFRKSLITHLQEFLTLTTETETGQLLPPPKSAATRLNTDVLRAMQEWHEKFGKAYRKLDVGYDYLKNCKHIDFNNIQAQSIAERKRIEEEEKKKQKMMASRLEKALTDIRENREEIDICLKEADSCLGLILPNPFDFTLPTSPIDKDCTHRNDESQEQNNVLHSEGLSLSKSQEAKDDTNDFATRCTLKQCDSNKVPNDQEDDSEKDESDISEEEEVDEDGFDLQVHGLQRPGFSLTIELPADSLAIKKTEDNADIMQSLQDASKLISSSYLPKVTKWLEILGKNGGEEHDIKAMIDLKVELESTKAKCLDLKLAVKEEISDTNMDSDDEDLEDVPEKEGYESGIPEHITKECGISSGTPAHLCPKRKASTDNSTVSTDCGSDKKKMSTTLFWSLRDRARFGSISDPTSRAAALARLGHENPLLPSTSKSSQESAASSNSSPSSSQGTKPSEVPYIEFGKDLAHWENPDDIEAPQIIKYDSLHRFWTPAEKETEKASQQDKAALQYRVINFTGNFEPVRWKCRALMPCGKLCERMDRLKCPFHGKIIARNKDGKPNDSASDKRKAPHRTETVDSTVTDTNETQLEELQPWKDPDLQREIEEATGHDLGSARSQKLLDKASKKGKGKGKGRGKKFAGLTNINAAKSTARTRLEKRVFSKGSLKKVCARLDAADFKRVRDKFGNQFNYSIR